MQNRRAASGHSVTARDDPSWSGHAPLSPARVHPRRQRSPNTPREPPGAGPAQKGDETADVLGDDEREFLAERDSFYLASVGASGWPYVQHRGGPRGFVHVLDEHTIAFADRRGNRQYVSVGNLAGDDRVALIFVDYPSRTRLKVLARARLVGRTDDPALFDRLAAGSPAEHVMVLRIEGLDWNCPLHITPRFTEDQVREIARPLVERLEALEAENAALRAAQRAR